MRHTDEASAYVCTRLDRIPYEAALFCTLVPVIVLRRTALSVALSCLSLWSCGPDAEARFAGLDVEEVAPPEGPSYRLRYLSPPWKQVAGDALVRGQAPVQFGLNDAEGDTAHPDLWPIAESARVLEIGRNLQTDKTLPDGVVTYPKYRLEVAGLDCEALGIDLPTGDSCAAQLRQQDESGRSDSDEERVLGGYSRGGTNAFGQRYHEFTTQVQATRRFRRVVYFETERPSVAVRLGFEANPDLGESEITRMIEAFELLTPGEP